MSVYSYGDAGPAWADKLAALVEVSSRMPPDRRVRYVNYDYLSVATGC